MLNSLRKLFRPAPEPRRAAVPQGERVYAIGDIHGRLDLFLEMIRAIEADDAARGPALTTVILLGDLIDRGPDSAGVVAAARDWQQRRPVRIVAGNHEEMLLLSLDSENVLRAFLRHGGRETLLSYPVDRAAYDAADYAQVQQMMRAAIPPGDIAFLAGFESAILIGDYLFVHAGIAPGVPIDAQRDADLRWIREPFLSYAGDHGCTVVHGHTITEDAEIRPNRIGIDTGAFNSGRLTALVLEGTGQWLLEARCTDEAMTTQVTPIA